MKLLLDWIRKTQPYLWIAVGLGIANLAWVMIGRYTAASRFRPKPAPAIYTGLGTGSPGVRILHFYAGSGEIVDGDSAVVCYGVENARAVRIEPAVDALTPSFNRCLSVTPETTTTYTLSAEGDGGPVLASFTIRVKPAPAHIEWVQISHKEVKRGQPVTICAKLNHALSARVDPIGWNIPVELNPACYTWFPPVTLTYTVTARGAGGNDTEKFKIVVR